ncbi:MAG: ATP-binding protein, partial [bacterium]
AEDFAKKHGFQASCRGTSREYEIANSVSVLLFQSARELLTNVVKHAAANRVSISLQSSRGRIVMRIVDNGKGMEPNTASKAIGAKNSFGLFSLRERMNHVGGTLEINSKPGDGTEVKLTAPMHEPVDNGADTRG